MDSAEGDLLRFVQRGNTDVLLVQHCCTEVGNSVVNTRVLMQRTNVGYILEAFVVLVG